MVFAIAQDRGRQLENLLIVIVVGGTSGGAVFIVIILVSIFGFFKCVSHKRKCKANTLSKAGNQIKGSDCLEL